MMPVSVLDLIIVGVEGEYALKPTESSVNPTVGSHPMAIFHSFLCVNWKIRVPGTVLGSET